MRDGGGARVPLVERLRLAHGAVRRDYERCLGSLDLAPMQLRAMREIASAPGRSQGVVAAALGIGRAAMVGLVDRMVRRDLIERRPTPGDRRGTLLVPTEAGRQRLASAEAALADHEAALLASLTEEERAVLDRILDVIAGKDRT